MIKFKYFLATLALLYLSEAKAQVTAIPDPVFEQYLVDFGIDSDGTINGQVLTSDIDFRTFLEINETPPIYAINDLTGIQDFASLEAIRIILTNVVNLDFGDLNNLWYVESLSNTQLTSVNISECESLERFIMNGTSLNTLLLPQTTTLERFTCTNGMLTSLDLSFYSALTYISVRNNQLESLNVANGNNTNVTFFRATGNPDLQCIIVDDVAYSEANWTNIDATTTFVESQAECDALSIEEFDSITFKVYPNPASLFFEIQSNQNIKKIDIIDITGKTIKSFNQSMNRYSVNDLSNGVYFLNIQTELRKLTHKLIINR